MNRPGSSTAAGPHGGWARPSGPEVPDAPAPTVLHAPALTFLAGRRHFAAAPPAGAPPPTARTMPSPARAADPLAWADPTIGTGGHGHTYPGATVPFGMVQASPDTHTEGWDWCSGYHRSDTSIAGFSQTHLSGTGVGDMLDVLLMPTVGPLTLEPGTREKPEGGYRSRFSHAEEKASPGYYSVRLADSGVRVELTATERVAVHRYTFPKSGRGARRPRPRAHVRRRRHPRCARSASSTTGRSPAAGRSTAGRRTATSTSPRGSRSRSPRPGLSVEGEKKPGAARGRRAGTSRPGSTTRTTAGEAVVVRVGLSPTSAEAALRNLEAEAPAADFDGPARRRRRPPGARALSAVAIEGATDKQRRIFTTALYHAFARAHPVLGRRRRLPRPRRAAAPGRGLPLPQHVLAVGHVPRRPPAVLPRAAATRARHGPHDARDGAREPRRHDAHLAARRTTRRTA